MDIEKLIKRLKCPQIQSCPMDGEYPSCKACQKSIQQEVVTALSTLQGENAHLQKEIEWLYMVKDLADRTKAELENVKGERYTAHDVAVLLAEVIGDDCACNVNGNDEWLPEKCELQDACHNPDGVACWEQWLKWRKKED